ncbi:hypothetical protein J7K99_00650, partial [bacterium]|nr:hypothetical protein [bacterium]
IITVFVIPIKALKRYVSSIKYRYQDADIMLLEFALLMWLYRIVIAFINDPFSSGNFDWIGVGIMYSVLYYKNDHEKT